VNSVTDMNSWRITS